MSPLSVLSQTNQPSNAPRSHLRTLGLVGLVLITILSLAYAGYTALNPHVVAVTQQQLVTNTRNLYSTQTVTTASTATSSTTITSTSTSTTTVQYGYGFGYGYFPYYPYPSYQNCGNYCPPPSSNYIYNYDSCNLSYASYTSIGSNNTVRCYGYLYQDPSGCTELVVPITNPYYLESPVYQYYTLHNLPSTFPPMGSWVTVTGQVYQGYSAGPSGAACPLNYINITSITQ